MARNQITTHFKLTEVACHDGTPYPVEWIESRLKPLLVAAEWIRRECGFPLHVSSGFRTEGYNRRIGGARRSQHVQGRALDLIPSVRGAVAMRKALVELEIAAVDARDAGLITGIGFYHDFVHIDTRPGRKVTWGGSRTNTENRLA